MSPKGWSRRNFVKASLYASVSSPSYAPQESSLVLANEHFVLEFDRQNGAIMSLRSKSDEQLNFVIGKRDHPEFDISDSRWLGDLILRYRVGSGPLKVASTGLSSDVRQIATTTDSELTVRYAGDSASPNGFQGIGVTEQYRLVGESLLWNININNSSSRPIEILDFAVPLLFNTYYVKDVKTTYTRRVVRHHLFAGDQTFAFFTKPDGSPPFLVMTPTLGTHFEYFDRVAAGTRCLGNPDVFESQNAFEGLFTAYLHAAFQSTSVEDRGSWRLPRTSRILAPKGAGSDGVSYGFRFDWVPDYDGVRDCLYRNGFFDVKVIPGMTVPSDLSVKLALRSRQTITAVRGEHAVNTSIRPLGRTQDTTVFELTFSKLGENLVTVDYGPGYHMYLEFFVTEPLEHLITKRASFIADRQQVRNSGKWYEGLFAPWDMASAKQRTPDDPGELQPYMVAGGDDPGLCKAPFIATKNVFYPDQSEIERVEYYLEHFVWGKLQRTDREVPFPYGIYGTVSWFGHRFSPIGLNSGGNGQEHMWRTFDYTHLIQLYYALYRVAKMYPNTTHYLDANGYLERAYGTAKAFYTIPYSINMGAPWAFRGWCDWAYKQGNFHEVYIPDLIAALEEEGKEKPAAWLRSEWEKKVKYMVYDHPYPFGSEMFFDTTAFESTHAVAKYGLEHELLPDKNLWRDKNTGQWYSHPKIRRADFEAFMNRSIAANVAARGWVETSFWQLGSDIRQHGSSNYMLSYMTQMGGWAILDYGLRYAKDSLDFIRLGFASYLASWALVNSGDAHSNYGYWYPGRENDGAAGWAFGPEKFFKPWAGPAQGRGAWTCDGEIDNGFSGALRSAATIVVNDPVFGDIAYGGDLSFRSSSYFIVMKDGIRQRLHLLNLEKPLHFALNRDGFSQARPVEVSQDGSLLSFLLEARGELPHETILTAEGLLEGTYALLNENQTEETFRCSVDTTLRLRIQVSDALRDVKVKRIR